MNTTAQIENYISQQPAPKCTEMQELHQLILKVKPGCKLWFADGKNSEGKVVANPNIGYGVYTIRYANGTTKNFFRIGLSANTTGISIYIMGIKDKTYLSKTYASTLGKAGITSYCIKFKTIKDISLPVLQQIIKYGFEAER